MAKKWADVLKDAATYPDDFTVALKDGQTLTLGEMRAYDRDNEGALTQKLTAREKELTTREQQLQTASVQLATVIEKTAERAGLTVEEFLQGKAAPTKKTVAAAADLDESDPLVGKLVTEIKGLRAELASTKTEIDTVKKSALGPMLNTYLEDYYEGQWEKISPTLPKGASVTREQALKHATDNGLKDSKGRLDLRKAARDLTYDARVKAEAEAMAADLRKKDDDARVLASAPRPAGTRINVKTDKSLLNEKGVTKNLDEVLNDALQDTDLWRGVAGNA